MALVVHEWRPGKETAVTWSLMALPLLVVGLVLFSIPVLLHQAERRAMGIGFGDVLAGLAITLLLFVLHEAIHGLVMLVFGARPRFGLTLVGNMLPAFYATAPGQQFARAQYLAVAAAPMVVISLGGFIAGFSDAGGYLVLPLAVHLSGCVGDAAMIRMILRQPGGTLYEDLADGIRFFRPV